MDYLHCTLMEGEKEDRRRIKSLKREVSGFSPPPVSDQIPVTSYDPEQEQARFWEKKKQLHERFERARHALSPIQNR